MQPQAPFYLFSPQNLDLNAEYQVGWKVTDIFPVNSVGIVTGQDKKTIAQTKSKAIELANVAGLDAEMVKPILYRPFDSQYIVYDSKVVTRNRHAVMRNLVSGGNMALITSRMTKGETFKHAQVTTTISEVICMSPKTSNNGFVFPLYAYPAQKKRGLFDANEGEAWPLSEKGRRPNLNPQFVNELAAKVGLTFMPEGTGDLTATFGPEDIFAYAYAVLHNPTYRDRYSEFLKMDFPRLPLTSDVARFKALVGYGAELVKLHLMTHPALVTIITTYPIQGDNIVAKSYPKYTCLLYTSDAADE